MAKAVGPLMSMDASGTVAGAITFTKWKGRNVVRQRVIPTNPQSTMQRTYRQMLAGLVKLWKANTTALAAAFASIATQRAISAFNAFTGYNQTRLSQGLYPADSDAPTEEVPSALPTALTLTAMESYVEVTWTDSIDANAWCNAIYRKLGAAPTGLISELEAIIPLGDQKWVDGPLSSGTWHYVIAAIHQEGGRTAVSLEETVEIA